MSFKFIPLAILLSALMCAAALDARGATQQESGAVESAAQLSGAAVITWTGNEDGRWSNPANWAGGRVPGATDVARFAAGSGAAVLVDAGALAGLILEADYGGTLTLGRDLAVGNELVLAGGTLYQADFSLSAGQYLQTGGKLVGGSGGFTVRGGAVVRGGTLLTSRTMTAASLTIESPAVVTMSADGKLSLTGDGEPLSGDGLLDVMKNRPNSVEYTGRASADVTAAAPLRPTALGRAVPSQSQMISRLKSDALKSDAPQEPTALGAPSFSRVGSLTLTKEERNLFCSVIDDVNGFAYFGTMTSPGIVVKVRLSDFTRVGAIVLGPEENELRTGVIDAANGFAYFGTITGPGIVVKIRLSDFTHVASLRLEHDEGFLGASVIDTAKGFAYFGTFTSPGIVVKIRLSDFTRVGALYLKPEEAGLLTAVIDPSKGFAYFGTDTVPGIVVKIRLSDFTRVAGLALGNDEDELNCSVIDTANGYAYFGSFAAIPRIIKVRLSDLTRVATLTLDEGYAFFLRSAVIDTARGFAYFSTDDLPGKIIKIRLSDFSFVGYLTLSLPDEGSLTTSVIDPAKGFAYFAMTTSNSVVKVRLSDFTKAAVAHLSKGENTLNSAVIDPGKGFAYFGTWDNPGLVIKVRLSDFTKVGVLSLKSDEIFLNTGVIDTLNGYAYFGTAWGSTSKIIKVRLSDFTRAGVLPLNAGERDLFSSVIDVAGGYAYFGTATDPALVVKIRLSDFTRVGALNTGQNQHRTGVIDAANGFAYFGGFGVVKVRLSDFTKVGAAAISETILTSVIDTTNGHAYFGTSSGKVIKLRLSDFARTTLQMPPGERSLQAAVIDVPNNAAYFGTATYPAKVIKVRLSDLTRVEALTLHETDGALFSAVFDPAKGFAYFGTGTWPGVIVKLDLSGAALAQPALVSPGFSSLPGMTIQTTTPTFQWDASAGATRYGLYISKYPHGPVYAVYQNETLTGTSFTIPDGVLLRGETYRWEMKAFNAAGESGVSNALYFNIPPPTVPSVTTAAATNVKGTTATLNATVSPNGADTTAWFEWGTSSTLATFSQTPPQSINYGASDAPVSSGLTGLAPNTTYYFRAAAVASAETARGSILSFRTPALPGLRVNNVSVAEANTGANTAATFAVTLSAASSQAVTVQYATANGTASATNDYAALALTTLTFSPGQTSKTVTVQVRGDALDEANETFSLKLSGPANATIADGLGVCTVLDNDPPPQVSITSATPVTEPDTGAVYASFTVKLSAASGLPVSVKYATGGGTATAGTDYTAVALTTLSFSPGQTSKVVRVQVKGDMTVEPNETFLVSLSGAVNATIAAAQGQGTILNDD